MDHLPDAVVEQDWNGQISAGGGRLEGVLGQPLSSLLGGRLSQLLAPEDRARFEQQFGADCEGPICGDFLVQWPDGTRITCEVSAHVSAIDARGSTMRAIFRDISQRLALQGEVHASQQRAIRSDRLASIGQLAAGVAHEINNPLAFVKANLGALVDIVAELQQALPAGSGPKALAALAELAQISEETVSGVDRIASIVKLLKLQAREVSGEVSYFDPAKAVTEAVLFFTGARQRRGLIDCQLPPLPNVPGDAGRLSQVIMNLLDNAFDAMGGEGQIAVRAAVEDGMVKINVADRGPGIPDSVRDHMFEPFFTTKGVGKGTGLGLHISHQIIAQAGGTLTFETGPEGTIFSIRMPCQPR